ncbi:hypothetical protein HY449_01025 [Candidatus Pacearchaeota archaeon]|nr:hypothetical protein [Candidatus Pacearchaeota archaeon]
MKWVYIFLILTVATVDFFGFFSLTGYDTISLDASAGGALNPGPFSEGTLFGDIPETTTTTPSGGGASGGGAVVVKNYEVSPSEFDIELAVNTNAQKAVTVKNLRNAQTRLSIRQTGLDNFIILGSTNLSLEPLETKTFNVIFVALNQTGIFTGKIFVGSKEIPVSISIRTKLLLFDSNIIVLNPDYLVSQGETLKTQITLIPLGESSRLDVTLNYVIKDYNNKIYLTKSETLLVDKQIDFNRDFDTGILPSGKYIVGVEVIYSNGVATSSAHFEVLPPKKISLSNLIYYLLIAILINIILIVALLISRIYKERKEAEMNPQGDYFNAQNNSSNGQNSYSGNQSDFSNNPDNDSGNQNNSEENPKDYLDYKDEPEEG